MSTALMSVARGGGLRSHCLRLESAVRCSATAAVPWLVGYSAALAGHSALHKSVVEADSSLDKGFGYPWLYTKWFAVLGNLGCCNALRAEARVVIQLSRVSS